ncbi:unnamed protein product [marine sediment metagenome]|uniref:Uncharacterized protein n=1 Tax=marine sediment metagenome TaxID=412755 RepID=X0RTY5_9ZZZZ
MGGAMNILKRMWCYIWFHDWETDWDAVESRCRRCGKVLKG